MSHLSNMSNRSHTSDAAAPGWRVWLLAARPKTLPAAFAPVLMGTAMAWEAGGFHAPAALAALLAALLIQVGTNYANDYFDFVKGTDTEERVGPTRATQAGLVTPAQMRNATAIVLGLAALVGLYLAWRGGWPILLVAVVSILCAVLYTGGPYPLGYLGLGDLFVLIFFGPVAVAGTYYVQALELSPLPVIAGFAPGLLATAILTVNNLRDVEGDAKSGKKTLAVRFGKRFARAEYVFCVLTATLLVPLLLLLVSPDHRGVLLAILTILPANAAMSKILSGLEGAELNPFLGRTGMLLLLFSLLFSFGWLL